MCGISGFWSLGNMRPAELMAVGEATAGALVHRGPDAGDIWKDNGASLVMAHRRLSILDLSAEGAQPMLSPSGRYVIVYNGEIYNHLEVRRCLDETHFSEPWRGHSDTETLLAAIEVWGVEEAVRRSSGMFAFALWDCKEKCLVLARDRMGEKPLYYGQTTSGLAFASELKALHQMPGFKARLNHAALRAFLDLGYVPDPQSIYDGISKLEPGAIMRFISPTNEGIRLDETGYFIGIIEGFALKARDSTTFDVQSKALESLLTQVIASQMISDVPLGSFLSGGIDSSLVTALMQEVSDRPVKSFSIGFGDADFDESTHAAAVAAHLGTDHTEFRVTEADALSLIPELPRIYDEPFADSSQVPTALLCRSARKQVTVALTGDGGDEVFGGYNRYIKGPPAWNRARALPRPLRRMIGPMARLMHQLGGSENAALRAAIGRAGLPVSTLYKISRLGEALGNSDSIEEFYRAVTRVGRRQSLLRSELLSEASTEPAPEFFRDLSSAEWMMAMDSIRYLPGDIIVKVDRAGMAASLETRAPFLDRRVVEAAWQLPLESKIAGGVGKYILRDILDRHVPRHLIERPKQGFGIPLDSWLRGGLRDWAETLLSRGSLEETGIFDVEEVRSLWTDHREGRRNEGKTLWPVLMFMAWLEENSIEAKDKEAAT